MKIYILVIVFILYFITLAIAEPAMLGPAELKIHSVEQCPNSEKYIYHLYAERRKINRTHDVFNANVTFDVALDESVGIYINLAKWGDGGYKPNYYIIEEKNACQFGFKWVGNSLKDALTLFNRPHKCPIEGGTFVVKNYILDYGELEVQMIYGDFRTDISFRRYGIDEICIRVFFSTKPKAFLGRKL